MTELLSLSISCLCQGFPGGSVVKNLLPRQEISSLISGNGNPIQYSFLENSMDRGAQWATVHRVAKSWT